MSSLRKTPHNTGGMSAQAAFEHRRKKNVTQRVLIILTAVRTIEKKLLRRSLSLWRFSSVSIFSSGYEDPRDLCQEASHLTPTTVYVHE